jgi:hypothetical protein
MDRMPLAKDVEGEGATGVGLTAHMRVTASRLPSGNFRKNRR